MQVKLQAGVQLPPITQRLVFYEQVELESQALEKRRGELMSKLTTLSKKRKEVKAKWDQVCAVYKPLHVVLRLKVCVYVDIHT